MQRNYANRDYKTCQRRSKPIDYDDRAIARAQFRWLKWYQGFLGRPLEIGWQADAVRFRRRKLSWPFVRDFDRGLHTLWFLHEDGDWWPCPIDDFASTVMVDKFMAEISEPPDWREVLRFREARHLTSYVTTPVPGPRFENGVHKRGKRSDVIWKIAMTLRQQGASREEIATVLRATKAWQSKHGNSERRLEKEIERVFSK